MVFIGFFGYLKYGDATSVGAITLNLPTEQPLATAAQIAIVLGIIHFLDNKDIKGWILDNDISPKKK